MWIFNKTKQKSPKLFAPDYKEQREGNWLLVWRDVPHWIIADNELNNFLSKLDGKIKLNELFDKYSCTKTEQNTITRLIDELAGKGIIQIEGKTANKLPALPDKYKIENIAINITNKCNLNCSFCYNRIKQISSDNIELPADEIISFIKSIRQHLSKTCFFTILGGEPTMAEDKLLELCHAIRKMGYVVIISSNGINISDKFASQAAQLKLQIQISLDGHNARIHEESRGKETFEKTIAGIEKLVSAGVYTIINMVCTRKNIDNLNEYFELGVKLGVNEVRFIPMKLIGGGLDNNADIVKIDEIIKKSYEILSNKPEYHKLIGSDALSILANTCRLGNKKTTCGTGLQTFLLDADGKIYPCLNTRSKEFELGNITDKVFNFSNIWDGGKEISRYRALCDINHKDCHCRNCIVKHWCLGNCKGENHAVNGSLLSHSLHCREMKKTIFDLMWIIADNSSWIKDRNKYC